MAHARIPLTHARVPSRPHLSSGNTASVAVSASAADTQIPFWALGLAGGVANAKFDSKNLFLSAWRGVSLEQVYGASALAASFDSSAAISRLLPCTAC